jgi:hypothetical protein
MWDKRRALCGGALKSQPRWKMENSMADFNFDTHENARNWLLSFAEAAASGMIRSIVENDKPRFISANKWASEANDAEMMEILNALPPEAKADMGI